MVTLGMEGMDWHGLDAENVMAVLGTSPEGLASREVVARRERFGANLLEGKKKRSPVMVFFGQFKDLMTLILAVAAVISGIVGDLTDSFIILGIAILNGIISFVQEYRADRALEELKKMGEPWATVVREGEVRSIAVSELVPGDVVLLETGAIVPADLRLYESHSLRTMEASLTGESQPVDKQTTAISADSPIGDRIDMVYKGTVVVYGRGRGIVTATGTRTELGRIAGLLQEQDGPMPLQRRMAALGKRLSVLILVICGMLFLIGLLKKEDPVNLLLIVISLAVAAIPEALPAVTTVLLALGARRLVRQQALIRKLPAVEALGSVSVICTDKTGTLTQNKMEVSSSQEESMAFCPDMPLSPLECAMVLNNDVYRSREGWWQGDPTEIALMEHVERRHGKEVVGRLQAAFPRVAEIPFDGGRKCMTTVHRWGKGFIAITKGATEVIGGRLDGEKDSQSIAVYAGKLAEEGYRVLGFGWKRLESLAVMEEDGRVEQHLEYLGSVALIDPPRVEAAAAITQCRAAGIRPVMITGDHPGTAATIARQLGVLEPGGLVISGGQLALMPMTELDEKIEQISVYARVSPEQKLRIVKAFQKKGYCVAMTGDGVNDAASLKAADVGVAMGITGTDVSREAADMVLLDDNFATIVKAVQEGRRIYDNIRKFLKYILTCNSAEVLTVFVAPLAGLPMPLLPVQILWINLITDGLPGLALALEGAEPDIMKRAPRPAHEHLLNSGMGWHILRAGLLMTGVALGLQVYGVRRGLAHWQTMVFAVMSLSQLGHVLSISRDRELVFRSRPGSNLPLYCILLLSFLLQLAIIYFPFGNRIFRTQPLSFSELLVCIVLSSIVFHAVEAGKWIRGRSFHTKSTQ